MVQICNTRAMEINDYILNTTRLSIRQLAERAGMDHTKLARQLRGSSALTMETLRDVARGTGLDMLDLFQRAGLITPEEVAEFREGFDVTRLTDKQLAAEVLRRMDRGSEVLEQPIDEPLPEDVPKLSDRRRRVTAEDVTAEDLMSEAAYTPEDGETPDRDSY